MSSTNRTLRSAAIQNLNSWLVSIGLWLMIVGSSGIWSVGVTSKLFWINFSHFSGGGTWDNHNDPFRSQRSTAVACSDGRDGS
jgi:hypothetical protein